MESLKLHMFCFVTHTCIFISFLGKKWKHCTNLTQQWLISTFDIMHTTKTLYYCLPMGMSGLEKKRNYGLLYFFPLLLRNDIQQCASLVAQTVRNLPAMWESQFPSLGWEDPLEKGMATHSSILAWRIPWTEEPGRLYSPWGPKASDMTEQHFHFI